MPYHRSRMPPRQHSLDDHQFQLIAKAVADPKRFEILQRLAGSNEAPTCTCIRDWMNLAPATISHHVQELDEAGLIEIKRAGKFARISFRREVWAAYLERLSSL